MKDIKKVKIEIKNLPLQTAIKLRVECAKKGFTYAQWVEDKLSTSK